MITPSDAAADVAWSTKLLLATTIINAVWPTNVFSQSHAKPAIFRWSTSHDPKPDAASIYVWTAAHSRTTNVWRSTADARTTDTRAATDARRPCTYAWPTTNAQWSSTNVRTTTHARRTTSNARATSHARFRR